MSILKTVGRFYVNSWIHPVKNAKEFPVATGIVTLAAAALAVTVVRQEMKRMNTPFVPADLRPLTPEQFKASVARQYDEKFAKFGLTWATRDARIAAMSAPVVPVIPVAPAPRPRTVGSWSTGYDYLNTK